MYHLPSEIQTIIYEYDPTYIEYNQKCLQEIINANIDCKLSLSHIKNEYGSLYHRFEKLTKTDQFYKFILHRNKSKRVFL